ncbi:MAG TPA: hypothetical protein VKG24_29295, partial [Pseudolabrys sp.]|nr:hypothetical protein [Pseudolabrys sp.]
WATEAQTAKPSADSSQRLCLRPPSVPPARWAVGSTVNEGVSSTERTIQLGNSVAGARLFYGIEM